MMPLKSQLPVGLAWSADGYEQSMQTEEVGRLRDSGSFAHKNDPKQLQDFMYSPTEVSTQLVHCFSLAVAMAQDPQPTMPAAGGYRRIEVPQRGRPPSPPPQQLPGCVPGLTAENALVFEWHAGGTPVQKL